MRAWIVAVAALTASAALADELDDAHRQALAGRDSYWNCLAQEYSRGSNKGLSGEQFTALIAGACPSERQNLRVALVGYLSLRRPDGDDAADPIATANRAIASAQQDVVTAFIRHKAASK